MDAAGFVVSLSLVAIGVLLSHILEHLEKRQDPGNVKGS